MSSIPISQAWTVFSYIWKQRRKGVERFPLVLMLEPLFRCSLACAGCGKVQYPPHVLKRELTPEECFAAVEECGAPMVSIPGGEPLLHPKIVEIVNGLVARKKYVYLCTNALILKQRIADFTPSKYLSFSVHLDGQREHHDFSVCREGAWDLAVEGIKEAVRLGFRVTPNATFFEGADPNAVRAFFDEAMAMGVEGVVLSPGYSYDTAPDKNRFLTERQRTRRLFRAILSNRKKTWKFNMSPLFLEFLMGLREYECTPWGMPAYSIFGWQRPCYLQQDGYAESFRELLETTDWSRYGYASGNPKCSNCMVSCGYEQSAVLEGFTTWKGFRAMASGWGGVYPDAEALKILDEPVAPEEQQHVPDDEVHERAI
jgi:hopanoid biosynthesis associated radical SAM protein HpnH